jgi:hypothetical protein
MYNNHCHRVTDHLQLNLLLLSLLSLLLLLLLRVSECMRSELETVTTVIHLQEEGVQQRW